MSGEPSKNNGSIAIVPWDTLGDGAIFLVLAENFRRAGFRVSYFSNAMYQMRNWLPQLDVKPSPEPSQKIDFLRRYDVIINDICSPLTAGQSTQNIESFSQKIVSISSNLDIPASLQPNRFSDSSKQVLQKKPTLEKVLMSNGTIRGEKKQGLTMVDYAVDYCKNRCGLIDASSKIELTPPLNLIKHHHSRRVVILPTTESKKEYSIDRFVKVAFMLSEENCDVQFVVLPSQIKKYRNLLNPWPVRSFDSVEPLANFIYESAVTLCNDSGGGHLSSMLGTPTVVIYRKRDFFEYCPGWGKSKVVRPYVVPKILGKRIWMPFLPPSSVAQACIEMIGDRVISEGRMSVV